MQFYVYHLIDPRDQSVFYVGKGQRNRLKAHAKEAARGLKSAKCDRIREIVESGQVITEVIVKRFDDEEDAYAFEAEEITRLRPQLTNIMPGGGTARCSFKFFFPPKPAPRPLTQDESDITVSKFVHKWFYVTDCLKKEAGIRMFNQWIPLPNTLLMKMLQKAREVMDRRGVAWLAQHCEPRIVQSYVRVQENQQLSN